MKEKKGQQKQHMKERKGFLMYFKGREDTVRNPEDTVRNPEDTVRNPEDQIRNVDLDNANATKNKMSCTIYGKGKNKAYN